MYSDGIAIYARLEHIEAGEIALNCYTTDPQGNQPDSLRDLEIRTGAS